MEAGFPRLRLLMLISPHAFLRFRETPPSPKEAVPKDRIDMFYSKTEGKFVARNSSGQAVKFDADASSTAIPGTTTNDNAAAGNLGEFIESSIGLLATSLSNGTALALTSVSLPVGDWDVEAQARFNGTNASISGRRALISDEEATFPVADVFRYASNSLPTTTTTESTSVTVARRRYSLAATTTVYLNVLCAFSAGSVTAQGFLSARRVR